MEAYDGEISLGVEENMILNEYVVKSSLEHEMKKGNKVVKKELIVILRGEIYFVKFIINPEEDDVEPGVIFGISFLSGGHLTQEEAAKEALAIRISQKFTLLEEVRHVIKTMAYHDKYMQIIDEIWKYNVELDGKIVKEEEKAVKKIKVGVTTIIAKFLILYIPIDRDAPIVDGRGFLYNRTTESDSDDEEEYQIKRNKFEAPIYGPYLNCNDPAEQSLALQAIINPFQKISVWKKADVLNRMGCDGEINDMLRIRLHEAGSNEEIFTSVAWIRDFNINGPIYAKLCHEFYSTYVFDEVCADDELQTNKIIKQFISKIARKSRVLTDDVLRSLSALMYYRDLDTTTLRDLIESEGKLIPEDPQPGIPRVGVPRPPRASM
uniref:Uncharacterized protein n=1 Tax=Tanacetum cinerariifolium TaxID=118510 RepID=A0A6L2LQY6_TANCI|nr:hypothetical protein [Tanacetum cinerariifolium]GEV19373.1 hypothetical protein [Tanacetum cinerariifolium]